MTTDQENLFNFPCEFPIKAMGQGIIGLENVILEIVRKHAPETNLENIKTKSSRGGKYISVTVTIMANSRAQLDEIYQDLTAHPNILMAF